MKKQKPQLEVDTKIQHLESQIQELDTKWKRALADYQNLEKRVIEQKAAFAKLATAGLIEKILKAVDDLERASKHINDSGLSMISNQFISILKEEGLEEINALGEDFNPSSMECVEVVPGEKEKVIKVAQKGYMIYGSVLRPAQVEVGNGEKI